jgi:peptidoglycan/xylan/chitin deacetylase (PgdA/CDA1 family)
VAKYRIYRAFRRVVFVALRWSALPWLVRKTVQRGTVTILIYHRPDPEQFGRHVDAIRKRYAIVPLRSYVEARASGKGNPRDRASVVLTLDDGLKENFRLLETVRDLGIPITVFLTSGLVDTKRHFWFLECAPSHKKQMKEVPDEERLGFMRERGFTDDREYEERQALTGEEIQAMKGFFDFQAHTLTHPILPACSLEKARREICNSREDLARRFGLEVFAFAYPNGNYCERDVNLVGECGYACAVTLDHGFNTAATDPLRLKRILVDDDDEIAALLVKVSGIWGWPKKVLGWKGSRGLAGLQTAGAPSK